MDLPVVGYYGGFTYIEFSPNANFITADFVYAVFQNFPDKFS